MSGVKFHVIGEFGICMTTKTLPVFNDDYMKTDFIITEAEMIIKPETSRELSEALTWISQVLVNERPCQYSGSVNKVRQAKARSVVLTAPCLIELSSSVQNILTEHSGVSYFFGDNGYAFIPSITHT